MNKLKVWWEILYNDKKYQNIYLVYDFIKVFENDEIKVVLLEVHKLFSLIQNIPSTSVLIERNISYLKQVKPYYCNSIS